jgi:hypothetical protein
MAMQHQDSHVLFPAAPASLWLRVGAVGLPLLKCAVCPACLSIFGSLFAGARFGFVQAEPWHELLILVALIADFAILGASFRHHGRRSPLWLCMAGALLVVLGHLFAESLESLGFALLLAAGVSNLILLRRHHRHAGNCCAHVHGATATMDARNAG